MFFTSAHDFEDEFWRITSYWIISSLTWVDSNSLNKASHCWWLHPWWLRDNWINVELICWLVRAKEKDVKKSTPSKKIKKMQTIPLFWVFIDFLLVPLSLWKPMSKDWMSPSTLAFIFKNVLKLQCPFIHRQRTKGHIIFFWPHIGNPAALKNNEPKKSGNDRGLRSGSGQANLFNSYDYHSLNRRF